MAQYTSFDTNEIKNILKKYNICNLLSYKVLSGGSENTNYLIICKTGKFVLTVCEQKSYQEALELAQLLEHLATNNFSTSKVISDKNGALVLMRNDKPLMLKHFLEGDVKEDLPLYLMTFLGEELAKLHQISAPEYLPKTINYGIEKFNIIEKYAPNSDFHNWLKEMKEYIKSNTSPSLPKVLIHSDIFYSNIIVSENGESATIMDFEEATHYYRVFDIGMMIVGTCCQGEKIDLDKITCLLEGYQKETKLLEIELKALQSFTAYAAAATAFWRHKQYHYVQPDVSMQNHYLAMKEIANKLRKMARFKKSS